jgi:hypothetical protein
MRALQVFQMFGQAVGEGAKGTLSVDLRQSVEPRGPRTSKPSFRFASLLWKTYVYFGQNRLKTSELQHPLWLLSGLYLRDRRFDRQQAEGAPAAICLEHHIQLHHTAVLTTIHGSYHQGVVEHNINLRNHTTPPSSPPNPDTWIVSSGRGGAQYQLVGPHYTAVLTVKARYMDRIVREWQSTVTTWGTASSHTTSKSDAWSASSGRRLRPSSLPTV